MWTLESHNPEKHIDIFSDRRFNFISTFWEEKKKGNGSPFSIQDLPRGGYLKKKTHSIAPFFGALSDLSQDIISHPGLPRLEILLSGWWWLEHDFYFARYWEFSSSQLTNSYFSEGLKPPTRFGSWDPHGPKSGGTRLVDAAKLSLRPSLWNLWAFVDVLYWQLKEAGNESQKSDCEGLPSGNLTILNIAMENHYL